ncbi:hypothetical protein LTS17_000615 [Exophiala oligosperma]
MKFRFPRGLCKRFKKMRFRDTRSPADVLEELAAVLRDSIDSFMSSTEPGPDNETTPAVSQQSPQRTTDSSNRDTPYQPLEELDQQEMTYHDYEAAQLLTNLRAHSESENAQLLTDQRANSESGWMSVNLPPGIPVSGRVQESELDHAARHMEVSEENYAEEWWETYSGSDSDSGSDPDSDSDSETFPADTNTEDWIPDSSWGSEGCAGHSTKICRWH